MQESPLPRIGTAVPTPTFCPQMSPAPFPRRAPHGTVPHMNEISTRPPRIDTTSRPWLLTRQHLEARYGRTAIDTAIASGALTRLARDLYAPTLYAGTLTMRARAAIAATEGRGVISGLAGLFLTRVIETPPERILTVIDRHHHELRTMSRVTYYRATVTPPVWIIDGLAVAEPEWCLAHAMRELPAGRRKDTALMALASDAISPTVVADLVARFTRMRGRGALRAALEAHDDGIHSPLEDRAWGTVLVGTQFAHLRRQYELVVEGRRMILDAYDERSRLAIEFDGERFHIASPQWHADRERDALLASVGIQTLRFTWRDVCDRPLWCRRMVEQTMRQRLNVARAA